MTTDQIRQAARTIALNARNSEWQQLNRQAVYHAEHGEYGASENCLFRMADLIDANVGRALEQVPEAYREDIGAAVNEFFGQLCGLI